MKNEKDLNFFKNFLDLIPEPLVIINKENLKVFYVNLEFQIQFEKSQSKLKYLRQIINKLGVVNELFSELMMQSQVHLPVKK